MPSSSSPSKTQISSSTLDTNTNIPPELQDQLKAALLRSGGVRNIEHALREELSRAGWIDSVRKHVQELIRSGQAVKYNDIMARLTQSIIEGRSSDLAHGANGASDETNGSSVGSRLPEQGGIKVPDSVMKRGVGVTLQELEKVADIVEDD